MLTLITGAGGALGSAVARLLVGRGQRVALVERRPSLATLGAELGAAAVSAYVSDSSSAEFARALAECEAAAGEPVSCAALVAGGWAGGVLVHEGAHELADMLDLNTLSVHAALAGLLPGMVARGAGAVVIVGSRNVERPWSGKGSAAYTASKAAAVAFAHAAAAEVLSSGVRVNSVLISTMDTEANREGMPDADPTRWVSTESAAGVVAFLLSEEARDISGASVPVYGRA
ncbi:MAG: SDR family NAD(P)-dependent oxidoreductase [Myxococcales bacterium]|nr:SDR family NAD(P)-dependent oxidoreductase [Myxococcales bacterium]